MEPNKNKILDGMEKNLLKEQVECLEENEKYLNDKISILEKEFHDLQSKLSESINLKNEKAKLEELTKVLESKTKEITLAKKTLDENISEKNHLIKELEQTKIILKESNDEMEEKISELERSNKKLNDTLDEKSKILDELKQEKMIHDEISKDQDSEKFVHKKKYYLSIAIICIVLVGIVVPYSVYMTSLVGKEYQILTPTSLKSGYSIENLRGDSLDTHLLWKLVKGDTIHISILNSGNLKPELTEVVKKVILSEEVIEVDNSLLHKGLQGTTSQMFLGWKGALLEASKQDTVMYIPVNFEIVEQNNSAVDITIELTNRKNGDGFSGWTSTIADESENQILKSRITIFGVDRLSTSEIETIVRHEFAHAVGLAHSTAPEDLMHPTIKTNFPYISQCDIDAIVFLYNGGKNSQVICEI